MLYTRKGDQGTTKLFNTPKGERVSKASCQTEALGAMDEMNSFLGLVKVKSAEQKYKFKDTYIADLVHGVQANLFIIQAELAGSDMTILKEKIDSIEAVIDAIEKEMPPITTFFISGGTELASLFDISRTLARKAERRVIKGIEEESFVVGEHTRQYLNRLSSLLYALARYANHSAGISETAPNYT
ncbi:MAG: cob(I)yrinic acid a,c-diamide adenosyltransferase [Candidatus Paceibacterota bacterium]